MLPLIPALSLVTAQNAPPTLDPTYTTRIPHIRTGAVPFKHQAAKWIWSAHTEDNQVLWFQRPFQLPSAPRKATLYITADNYFDVALNGQELGSTKPGTDGSDEGWRTIHSYDVTRLVHPGENLIHLNATNAGGPAGLLARLEVDGRPILETDKSWRVAPQAVRDWAPATEEAPAGEGAWGSDLTGWPEDLAVPPPAYLLHKRINAAEVATVAPDPDALQWGPRFSDSDYSMTRFSDPDFILDFGEELSGRIVVRALTPCQVVIAPGESAGEAIEKPYVSRAATLQAGRTATSPWSAQRYARITLKPLGTASPEVEVYLEHLYYPVAYQGSFNCSDPLLTKAWYTGAYTAHLCMQQDIWDAPKRDRARWMGDLHVSGETINNAFLDRFLMEQTMRRLREDAQGRHSATDLPAQHVNGIPGYSCAWIAGMADFYRHTGDLDYIKTQHQALVTLVGLLKDELGTDGVFENRHGEWPFVDWSPDFDKDTPQARAATHLFFAYGAKEAAFLLDAMGDTAQATQCRTLYDTLEQTAQEHLLDGGTFGDRRQENAMAIYSGVATPDQQKAIWDKVLNPDSASWSQVVSPYYSNYVIFAMSECGHTQEAMDRVRSFWGGMLREGATSFWEGYDPSWEAHDFHRHLQADDGTGFFVSLCHGWSSGVTSWLTERVLGVRSTGGGFSTCDIQPDLADLKWAEGDVPTPHGPIHVRAEPDRVAIELPKGVIAHVSVFGTSKTLDARSAPAKATFSKAP